VGNMGIRPVGALPRAIGPYGPKGLGQGPAQGSFGAGPKALSRVATRGTIKPPIRYVSVPPSAPLEVLRHRASLEGWLREGTIQLPIRYVSVASLRPGP